jgi:hypothetical protein
MRRTTLEISVLEPLRLGPIAFFIARQHVGTACIGT